jgi:5-hydroxyisourate hydrolase
MSHITTHVLDTSLGKPAAHVPVLLELQIDGGHWKTLGQGATDVDGRLNNLLVSSGLMSGVFRLTFDTAAYFASRRVDGFYPQVSVTFEVKNGQEHYHVPLLLSPYGYSTYRGS